MQRQPLIALLAALFAFPAAAINVPLPPQPPLAPDVPESAPLPPVPVAPFHVAASDAARKSADDAQRLGDQIRRDSEELSREIEAEMGALFAHRVTSHRVVKGQPYSAEVLTENRQALADGNVISRKTSGRVYRDAEGRTRDETEAREGKAGSIVIFDPVSGKSTVLLPDSKRAVVTAGRGPGGHTSKAVTVDGTEVRIDDGRVTVNGKEVPDGRVQVKTKSGREIKVENGHVFVDGKEAADPNAARDKRVIVRREDVDGMPLETVDVKVIRVGEGGSGIDIAPLPPVPPVPPVPGVAPAPAPAPLPGISGSFRFESTARLGKGVSASLGTKDFDGVRAEGKSMTWTIPAGQIGNAKPIHVVSETWYSPELQVTVYSRYSDPRTGESIYRLASIKRGAPAADLFQVPAGYQVRDRSQLTEDIRARERELREKSREDRRRLLEERRQQLDEQRHRLEEQQRELDEERRRGG